MRLTNRAKNYLIKGLIWVPGSGLHIYASKGINNSPRYVVWTTDRKLVKIVQTREQSAAEYRESLDDYEPPETKEQI